MTKAETDSGNGVLSTIWSYNPLRSKHRSLNWALLLVPAAIAVYFLHPGPVVLFVASALAIIPLAGVLGEATEDVAAHSGPTLGGLLNATMGNATEFIIAFFALRQGHIEVVKASLSGSIIGNLLLVFGLALLLGGFNRERQTFSRTVASTNATMLFVAVVALVMPAIFDLVVYGTLEARTEVVQRLSLWTSGLLILTYAVSFVFMLKTHKALFTPHQEQGAEGHAATPLKGAIISLLTAAVVIGFLSELMVSQIEHVTQTLGMTELFVGVIVVAIVGNAAEHGTAVIVAMQNKMDLSLTIAVGSSTQIALFVAPLLVFLSVLVGQPMNLVFNGFEIAAIFVSVLIIEMIASDGETNWFEGAQLLVVYALLAVAFYFVPETKTAVGR